MNEKLLAGIGGGLILIAFGIILAYPLFENVKEQVIEDEGTPGFTQLREIKDEAKEKIENNTVLDSFRKIVGNLTEDFKKNVKVGINATFSEPMNQLTPNSSSGKK